MEKTLPTLITIGPSHYCDKARWGMDFVDYKFKEESYPPIFHMIGTKKYKTRTVPILVTEKEVIKDSTDILKFIDKNTHLLYPESVKKDVEQLEEIFDTKLGPSTRRLAYYYLLNAPELIYKDFCDSSHPFYDSMYQTFFPAFKILIRKGLKVTKEDTNRARIKINEVFKLVEDRLADGRKYLTGANITAADITFAALASPVIMPRKYKKYKEKGKIDADLNKDLNPDEAFDYIDEMPEAFAKEIRIFRNSKAGKFVKLMYAKR